MYERRHDFSKLFKWTARHRSQARSESEFEAIPNNTPHFELKRTPSEKGRGRFFNISRIGSFTQECKEPEIRSDILQTDEQNNFKELQDDDAEASLEFGDPCIVKHQTKSDMEERFRQVNVDMKRLESKVDILLSALQRQILPSSFNSANGKVDVCRTTSV